uniref:Uncharacterized protein n=1 Tax=Rhizophora mucronata TaxID=61149 RepID=A0A2P2NV42_RHIMU
MCKSNSQFRRLGQFSARSEQRGIFIIPRSYGKG